MSYIGNRPATGDNNSFKILDDITSYTLTFDGSSASVVSTADNTIRANNHRFLTGQRVTYNDGGGTAITGLSDGVYYVIKHGHDTIQLADSDVNAAAGTAVNLSGVGAGTAHTLNVAFDGVNTKFRATYGSGTKAGITRAAQLQVSINGVIQQPQDTATPTTGFGIDVDSIIGFSTAPVSTDVFWGSLVASNFPTFDISDKILIFKAGIVQQYDNPEEMYCNPVNCYCAEILGDLNKINIDNRNLFIRPENINLVEKSKYKIKVEKISFLGKEYKIQANFNGDSIYFYNSKPLKNSKNLFIDFNKSDLIEFDKRCSNYFT